MLINNVFFYSIKSVKTKAFDSYSKDPSDIYNFYLLKKEEISDIYRRTVDLPDEIGVQCASIDLTNLEGLIENLKIEDKAFELFIVGFIFFIGNNLACAKECFEKSISLMSNNTSPEILTNRSFLKMQISQIYDQLKDKRKALSSLLEIHQLYKKNPVLFETADSLIASVFFRMSIYSIRVYKTYNLSHATSFLSITYREKFRSKYEQYVLEQYLATAYRNYAPTFQYKSTRYSFYMEALRNRLYVAENNKDEFNKVELFYLLSDINRFLIIENFKIALVKKHCRKMFNVISAMHPETRTAHVDSIIKYSLMLSKFFFVRQQFVFYPWLTIASHFIKICKDQSLTNEYILFKAKVNEFYPES